MRHVSRRFAAVFLVLYAVFAGALPLADALLPAAPQTAETHIEDTSERHHGMHDHLSCQLCRAIDRQGALDGDDVAPIGEAPRGQRDPIAPALLAAFSSPRSELGARAPPTA